MAGTKTQVQTGTGVQDYETSFGKGRAPTFLNMYGAASGNDTTDVLDKIISGQLSAKESYLPKLKALALQKEAERQETVRQEMQKTLLAEQAQAQAEQGAIGGAVRAGAMMLDKMPNPMATTQTPTQTAIQAPVAPTTGAVAPTAEVAPNVGVPSSAEAVSPTAESTQPAKLPSANTEGISIGGASPEGSIQEAKDMAITKEAAQGQSELLQNLKGHEIKADATSKELEATIAEVNDADSAHEAKEKMEKIQPLIDKLDVIQGVGKERVRDLKELGSGALGAVLGGFNLATTLAGGLENLDALDIANTGVGAAGTVGNLAKAGGELLNNQALANLGKTIGGGVGSVAPVLGLASGVQGIAEDPSNPVGYTNTAMAAINAVPVVANLVAAASAPAATGAAAAGGAAAGGAAAAPTSALGGASSTASAVALPLALIAAAEGARGAWGGPGKTWDEKRDSEKVNWSPGTAGAVAGPTAFTMGGGDPILTTLAMHNLYNANSNSVPGKFLKAASALERGAMAPIDWLFTGSQHLEDSFYDLADVFGW